MLEFKQEEPVYGSFKATPVEVIDGIDSEVRQRLSDYHIVAVQNLATANPIMLYVETPFGIYQVMDWVAQAQLCSSVGPACMAELQKLGIRTIFDLERVGTNGSGATTSPLRQAVGSALFRHAKLDGFLDPSKPGLLDDLSIIANIQVRLDDPHVHRLRQLYVRVKDRLGAENRRLEMHTTPRGTRSPGKRRSNGPLVALTRPSRLKGATPPP